MAASTNSSPVQRERDLLGQTVLVIGGSSGIGLETARLARAKGADIILTARDPDRLHRVGLELAASIAAFDATDFGRLERFFNALPAPIDHLLVTGPGPYYAPLSEFDLNAARHDLDAHLMLPLQVAKDAASKVRPGGTMLFMGGVGGRRPAAGFAFIAALTAALPAMTKTLALEISIVSAARSSSASTMASSMAMAPPSPMCGGLAWAASPMSTTRPACQQSRSMDSIGPKWICSSQVRAAR
jgi:NAD(P)-dependent dehydrogenase (short-subunit alcohol dehydrogenase family)